MKIAAVGRVVSLISIHKTRRRAVQNSTRRVSGYNSILQKRFPVLAIQKHG